MQTPALALRRQLPGLSVRLHMCFCKQLSHTFPLVLGREQASWVSQASWQRGDGGGMCIHPHSRDLPATLGATQNILRTLQGSWSRSCCCQEHALVSINCSARSVAVLRKRVLDWQGEPATYSQRWNVTCIQEQQPLYGTASLCIFGLRC